MSGAGIEAEDEEEELLIQVSVVHCSFHFCSACVDSLPSIHIQAVFFTHSADEKSTGQLSRAVYAWCRLDEAALRLQALTSMKRRWGSKHRAEACCRL